MPGRLDLSPGSVIHIKEFSSRGHPPKNKYVYVIGSLPDPAAALGFLISSQLQYLRQEVYRREVVRIPDRATHFLRQESIIQCFELEKMLISKLHTGFEAGRVAHEGRLPASYLYKVRECVENSRLLAQQDIEITLSILPGPTPRS